MTLLEKLQSRFSEEPGQLARQIQEFEGSVREAFARDRRPNIIITPTGGPYATNDQISFNIVDQGAGITKQGDVLSVSRSGMYQVNFCVPYTHVTNDEDPILAGRFAGIRILVDGSIKANAYARVQFRETGTNGDNQRFQASALVRIKEGESLTFGAHADTAGLNGRITMLASTGSNKNEISLVWVAE